MPLKIPTNIDVAIAAHKKWLEMVREAQRVVTEDGDMQRKAAKKGRDALRIKERAMPPEVLGRTYVQYCNLINRMYEAYLGSVHLQRAPYMKGIVSAFMKRLCELRDELVHLILNDYIYVDASLAQMKLTPADIEIVVPYHFAIEAREDSIEELLQTMWADAVARKNAPPPQEVDDNQDDPFGMGTSRIDSTIIIPVASVHSIIPEEYIQATLIQKQERYRQFYMADFKAKNAARRTYFLEKAKSTPKIMRVAAASLIQMVYRKVMQIKRKRVRDHQLDVKLGLVPDPWRPRLKYEEENRKLYDFRRRVNERSKEKYLEELEKQKARLFLFKKDDQMEDISDQIREWFNEWYLGYGFFPEYPYPVEGGTIMVIRGDFPTVEEKIEADTKLEEAMKGKTKEMLKAEKKLAQLEAKQKAELAKENQKKEALQEFKFKCNPFSDLGYKIKTSADMESLAFAIQDYSASWSLYDDLPPEHFADVIFGYLQPIVAEDVMCQLHQECRVIVDEFMRLELKVLIAAHQKMYKDMGKKYPKIKPRKKPKLPPPPKLLKMDGVNNLAELFDLGIISKPTNKISDILGDSNYAAYDLNIQDPHAKFPPPGYGDIRQRLVLSCVFGAGLEPKATRNRSVMLLGPPRNGKSFLVDCVAGELNAIKIDISPEVFSAVIQTPVKLLNQVFTAARVFQPTVIYLRNIERVFMTKVPPEDMALRAKTIKAALVKLVKGVAAGDRVIFIATCSRPFDFPAAPMVSLFDEIILVPRTDYGTMQSFFYYKLQSIRSMQRDYCVQSLAQLAQGFGFGVIIKTFEKIMNPERIVRLNVKPIMPIEFIEALMDESDPVTMEDFEEYVNFYIQNSPLRKERAEFEIINQYRAVAYIKMEKKKAEDEKKAAKQSKAQLEG